MAKKFKIKEAELLDDQMKEQNTPESTVIPATPEEVSLAADNVADPVAETPTDTTAPSNVETDIETPNGSADANKEETESPKDNGLDVQPETVSINVQVPVEQLGQAVAMATGDVRTAEISPDLEAEKASQAEATDEPPMVAESSEAIGQEPVSADVVDNAEALAPTHIEEPQPVQESLEHTVESKEPDSSEMGASYRNLMLMSKQKEAIANIAKESSILEEAEEDKIKTEDSVKEDAVKPVEDTKSAEDNTEIKEEPKEKLDFNALKKDVIDDFENSELPKGLAATDANFDDELGFGDSDSLDLADFNSVLADTFEDKNSEEISAASEALGAAATILGDAAAALDVKSQETYAEEENAEDDEYEEEDEVVEEPKEKLDFKALLADCDDDIDSEEDFADDSDFEDDFVAADFEETDDFEESRKRVPCKLPVRNKASERKAFAYTDSCDTPRFKERETPLVRSRKPILAESAQRKPVASKRDRLAENFNLDGIILPKGSENIDIEAYSNDTEDLVSAHERVLEARKKALIDFHRTMNESKDRTRPSAHPRYRESVRDHESDRPSNSRFNEALRSSVRSTRLNEDSYNANSWANNKALDKYEESQRFNFKELLKNGFLG